jgi:hypothetical protein
VFASESTGTDPGSYIAVKLKVKVSPSFPCILGRVVSNSIVAGTGGGVITSSSSCANNTEDHQNDR